MKKKEKRVEICGFSVNDFIGPPDVVCQSIMNKYKEYNKNYRKIMIEDNSSNAYTSYVLTGVKRKRSLPNGIDK